MVCMVFHMGPLVKVSHFFHISYGLYAISDGRTSDIKRYLSVAFLLFMFWYSLCLHNTFMGFAVFPLAYIM